MSWVYLLGVATVALARGGAEVHRRLRARRAAAVARPALADAREGTEVRVVGVVLDHDAMLTSPFTGRRCAYYLAEVRDACGMTAGEPRATVRAHAPLLVADASGRALVDLDGAEVVVEVGMRRLRVKDADRALAAAVDAAVASTGSTRRLRPEVQVRESALEVGAEVAVVGAAVREPDPDGAHGVTGYRGDAPTRLRFASTPARPLYVSDEAHVVAVGGDARPTP